ncbi:nucleoside 2-deoxyribosyltransferase [Comamonas endophytica]|uniref:nucleoside 2-deoxyribosyltransferase n=1 Tax=Comamonas endophytica TaxID=2949090 RepID=UPI001E2B9268|nr:nucleoside 2-deoxyribosyltransferase [Acidovorax sp. D4N7]MCD2514384.1 nucleoside 2-deoxyribosyltransferase [Acidovorax sp. D4N7]
MSLSVYLAGPEVFYPDARAHGRRMQAVCSEAGFTGLFPLDAQAERQSLAIYQANRQLIDRADAVVANLRDFRGFEPDSGTVWEASYALARGKPVVGYCPTPATIAQRLQASPHGQLFDAQCEVEDFGLPLNLMLAHSLSAVAFGSEDGFLGLKAALARLRQLTQEFSG